MRESVQCRLEWANSIQCIEYFCKNNIPISNANIVLAPNLWSHEFESQMCSERQGFTQVSEHHVLPGTTLPGTLSCWKV